MTPDYQFYHGAILHEIVTVAGRDVRIGLCDFRGRPDAFLIDGEIGLLLKHSSARITPWLFTFTKDHVAELHALRQRAKVSFVGLICSDDGFVCLRDTNLISILTPTAGDVASIRVERGARKMYRVSSSKNELDAKVANGVQEIIDEIRLRNTGCAPPSCES